MKIPMNYAPSTRASDRPLEAPQIRVTPDAFGLGVARALQGLGASITAYGEKAQKADLFDVRRRTIQETTDAQIDFNRRKNEAPLGAANFTQTLREEYEQRHAVMVDEAVKRGESPEAIEALTLSLAQLRNSLIGEAITFEGRSNEALVRSEMDGVGLNLAQLVSAQPESLEEAKKQLYDTIDLMPNLSGVTKEALKKQHEEALNLSAGYGLAQKDPAYVIDTLGGGTARVSRRDAIASIESAGSGGYAAVGPRHATLGRALGRYQIMEANIGPWSQKHLGRAVTVEEFMASPEIQDAIFDGVFGEYVEKYGEEGAAQAWFAGPGGVGKGGRKDALGTTVADYGKRYLKVLKQPTEAKTGKTGSPVLDSLSPAQRQQVLNHARTENNRAMAQARGTLDARVTNAETAYMTTGEYAGPAITREDFLQAYEPEEAERRWATFDLTRIVGEHINSFKTMSAAEIAAQVEALRPTDTGSPTYAQDLAAYETAQKAQDTLVKQRNADPAGYAMRHFPAVAEAWEAAAESPDDEQAQIEAYRGLNEAYKRMGVAPWQMAPIPSGMVEAFTQQLRSQSPEDRINSLVQMRTTMGSMFENGLRQLAENGMALEAYLAGLVTASPEHKTVAANVLRGMEVMANDPSRRPSTPEAHTEFRTILGEAQNTLSGEVSGTILQAAIALYVQKGGDPSVLMGRDLFEGAVREILGGSADDPSSGIYTFHTGWWGTSTPTILPPGVNAVAFTDWTDQLTDEQLMGISSARPMTSTGEPIPADVISSQGRFIRVAHDTYIVQLTSDNKFIMGEDGEYYKVRITPELFQ